MAVQEMELTEGSQGRGIHQAHMALYKLFKACLVALFSIRFKQVGVGPVHFRL